MKENTLKKSDIYYIVRIVQSSITQDQMDNVMQWIKRINFKINMSDYIFLQKVISDQLYKINIKEGDE